MGLLKDKGSEVNKQSLSDRDILKLYNDMEYIGYSLMDREKNLW